MCLIRNEQPAGIKNSYNSTAEAANDAIKKWARTEKTRLQRRHTRASVLVGRRPPSRVIREIRVKGVRSPFASMRMADVLFLKRKVRVAEDGERVGSPVPCS